ncbi:MAG: hypothetical protein K6E20_06140 [Acholeplasmatales bacterium]|nr:hypothetical protein [Acholeplasmatales bacterium]
MKPYLFNGENYNDLNSLALAYKANFELGVNDIYNNSRKLIKFVKSQTKNKDRIQNVIDDLTYTRFKENALTFIIFEFLDVKEVIINGVPLKYDDFINELKVNPKSKNNILFSFLADHGITRCYKRLEPDKKIFKDSYYIERHYNEPFTYEFLTRIGDFEIKEQPEKKLKTIAIQNEECFRRATKTINQTDFMLAVAKKYGFKEAIKIIKEKNPVFYTTKLFKDEMDDEESRRLVSDGFYWWLLDNYKNYVAKKKAIKVINRLNIIKNEYEAYQNKIKSNEISKIALDYYCDVSRKLYLCYLDFVHYFRNGLICVNKNVETQPFNLDKPYCKTYICEDYMKGRVIKLYQPSQRQEPKYNVLTGELIEGEEEIQEFNIDDVSTDEPVDELQTIEDDSIYKSEIKIVKANSRFTIFSIILSFVFLAISACGLIVKMIDVKDPNKIIKAFKDGYSFIYTVAGISASLVLLLFAIIYAVCLDKKEDSYNDYRYYKKANLKEELDLKQESVVYKIENNLDKLKKKILRSYKIFGSLVTIVMALSATICGIIISGVLSGLIDNLIDIKTLENLIYMLIVLVVPVVLSMLFGRKKKKGIFFALFIVLLSIGLAIGLAILM